jgi:hypothetical protein
MHLNSIEVAGEQATIRGYQIMVWVSLGVEDIPEKD